MAFLVVVLLEVLALRGRQRSWFLRVALQAACGPLEWAFQAAVLVVAT